MKTSKAEEKLFKRDPKKCKRYVPKPFGFGAYQCSRNKTHGEYCWQHKEVSIPEELK